MLVEDHTPLHSLLHRLSQSDMHLIQLLCGLYSCNVQDQLKGVISQHQNTRNVFKYGDQGCNTYGSKSNSPFTCTLHNGLYYVYMQLTFELLRCLDIIALAKPRVNAT